ncbi:MAG: hypothetical protein AB8I08_07230 [Sandaracinaceae bacterium]
MRTTLQCVAACGLLLGLFVGCDASDKDSEEPEVSEAQQAARDAANLRIGHVMIEVGHRMETAGRASVASQWGLAGYEVHEIIEVFDDDMGRALLPGVCNDDIADQMYFALKDEQLPALRQAAEDQDAEAFRTGFATAAASCNGCHATCEVAFIEVPTQPGVGVPRIGTQTPTPPTEVLNPWGPDPSEESGEAAPDAPAAQRGTPRREVLDPWSNR